MADKIIVADVASFKQHIAHMLEADLIAVDTETTGIEGIADGRDFLRGCSVAYRHSGYLFSSYFPWRHQEDNLPIELLAELNHVLQSKPLVWFNRKFDLHSFHTIGIELDHNKHPHYDGQVEFHMWNEEFFSKKLEDISRIFLKDGKDTTELDIAVKMWGWANIPTWAMNSYAKKDAELHLRVHEFVWPKLVAEELDILWPEEQEYTNILYRMEQVGIRTDKDFIEKKVEIAHDRMDTLDSVLSFNPQSSKQLGEFFIGELELPVLKRNKPTKAALEKDPKALGSPSFDKETLVEYDELLQLSNNPIARLVAEYRGWSTAASLFYEPSLKFADSRGYIHTNYKQHGTVTGRLSSSKPNLQQVPRKSEKEWNGDAKLAFLADNDEQELIGYDYCVSPETRILKTDLTWSTADKIKVGDELIGFDQDLRRSKCKMKPTSVVAVKRIQKPGYRLTMSNGDVLTCSDNHMWSVVPPIGHKIRQWRQTKDLRIGEKFLKWVDSPWVTDTTYEAGYLSGVYDGEGWISNTDLGFGQNPGTVIEYVEELLYYHYNIDCFIDYSHSSNVSRIRVGKVRESLRLLGSIRPKRLLPKAERLWNGRSPYGKFNLTPHIVKMEELGVIDVMAIETTEHTFIAEGYMSHNSQVEFRLAVAYGGDPALLEIFNDPDRDIFQEIADRTGLKRQTVKHSTYCMLYGGGLAKASATIAKFEGLPSADPETTRPHYENFKGTMPGVISASKRATNLAEQRGYVRLWTGRRRHLRSDHYRAFNSVLQGGGAELIKRSQIRLQAIENNDCRMVLQVHDEVVFKITKGYRETVDAQIIDLMTNWPDFNIKFKVEGKVWNQ